MLSVMQERENINCGILINHLCKTCSDSAIIGGLTEAKYHFRGHFDNRSNNTWTSSMGEVTAVIITTLQGLPQNETEILFHANKKRKPGLADISRNNSSLSTIEVEGKEPE